MPESLDGFKYLLVVTYEVITFKVTIPIKTTVAKGVDKVLNHAIICYILSKQRFNLYRKHNFIHKVSEQLSIKNNKPLESGQHESRNAHKDYW